jgi:hypothetical protein
MIMEAGLSQLLPKRKSKAFLKAHAEKVSWLNTHFLAYQMPMYFGGVVLNHTLQVMQHFWCSSFLAGHDTKCCHSL